MDWKDGLTAAAIIGIGYLGFTKVIKAESFAALEDKDYCKCEKNTGHWWSSGPFSMAHCSECNKPQKGMDYNAESFAAEESRRNWTFLWKPTHEGWGNSVYATNLEDATEQISKTYPKGSAFFQRADLSTISDDPIVNKQRWRNWDSQWNAESFSTEGKSFVCDACEETLPLKLRNRSLKVAQEFGMGVGDICRPCVKRIKSTEIHSPQNWTDYYNAESFSSGCSNCAKPMSKIRQNNEDLVECPCGEKNCDDCRCGGCGSCHQYAHCHYEEECGDCGRHLQNQSCESCPDSFEATEKWECDECGALYGDEDDAEDCCVIRCAHRNSELTGYGTAERGSEINFECNDCGAQGNGTLGQIDWFHHDKKLDLKKTAESLEATSMIDKRIQEVEDLLKDENRGWATDGFNAEIAFLRDYQDGKIDSHSLKKAASRNPNDSFSWPAKAQIASRKRAAEFILNLQNISGAESFEAPGGADTPERLAHGDEMCISCKVVSDFTNGSQFLSNRINWDVVGHPENQLYQERYRDVGMARRNRYYFVCVKCSPSVVNYGKGAKSVSAESFEATFTDSYGTVYEIPEFLDPHYCTVHGSGKYRFNQNGSDGKTWGQYRFKTKDEAMGFLAGRTLPLSWVKPGQDQYDFPPKQAESFSSDCPMREVIRERSGDMDYECSSQDVRVREMPIFPPQLIWNEEDKEEIWKSERKPSCAKCESVLWVEFVGMVDAAEQMYEDDYDGHPDGDYMERMGISEDYVIQPFEAESFSADSHGYSFAYNEGHSAARKKEDYRPNIGTPADEANFKRILKQKGD